MKRYLPVLFVGVCCLFGLGLAPEQAAPLKFPQNGFSISPLEDGGKGGMIMTMSLAAVDGFASNVNVMKQPYNDTLDAYVALSKKQFDDMKINLIKSDKLDDHTAILEYSGKVNDVDLHFYAKILWTSDHILLATATSSPAQWDGVKDKLEACVDSIKLEKAAQ